LRYKDINIAVIGLGYVGLPLSLAFAKKYPVKGYDINERRIRNLMNGYDSTNQVNKDVLQAAGVDFTDNISQIAACNVYIITVPTPVDHSKKPDLSPLLQASEQVGDVLKKGDVVIYESTVYPGCTEEDCVPVLEATSGLSYNHDFFCGYSPERISPGDELHTLENIVKITSGSTEETAVFVDELYTSIITAGTYKAPSIKVAEAAKAIENAQRDVNISFVNELSLICDKIGIDTTDVIEAAGTKWNFLKFKPGLVGGHCIGVDPYYLAHKAEALGYHPQVILSGRRVNDFISTFIVNKVVKLMIENGCDIKQSRVLILGVTFKENCPDIRNSKVMDIYRELRQFGMMVDVYDPWADKAEVRQQYNFDLTDNIYVHAYNAIILAVAHKEFLTIDFAQLKHPGTVVYDTKSVIDRRWVDARL